MEKVRLEGVSKSFGKTEVVTNVSMDVQGGELRVLVGPSGSGKTTILRLIAGLEKPSQGHIYINGQVVNDTPPKDRNIAMVFQNYALYPHFTVGENLAMPLKIRKRPRQEIERKVKGVSELLHISNLLGKKPGRISGGEQQRVALGRALVRDPEVFLLDEPLSNLDAKLRVEARGLLKKIQRELGVTTIFVTHDQSEALSLASVISVVRDGRIVESGNPRTIFTAPSHQFTATFLGSPPMNIFEGRILEEMGRMVFNSEGMKVDLGDSRGLKSGQKVHLGIRPEDISLKGEIEGQVTLIEPIGSIVYLTVSLGGREMVVQASIGSNLDVGDKVSIGFPASALRLFDEDGLRIISP